MRSYVLIVTVLLLNLVSRYNCETCREVVAQAETDFDTNSRTSRTWLDLLYIYHATPIYDYKCSALQTALTAADIDADSCLRLVGYFCDDIDEPIVDPCNGTEIVCSPYNSYRTPNGECNNLAHPTWGRTDTAFRRILPPRYRDNLGELVNQSACGDEELPSARAISNTLFATMDDEIIFESELSYMAMQWGQFISHDLGNYLLNEGEDGAPLFCCEDAPSCAPIDLPEDETLFGECLPYTRSQSAADCKDVAQHINTVTSYIDGSVIYGSSLEKQYELRTYMGGLLKTVDGNLSPDLAERYCLLRSWPHDEEHNYCPNSGTEWVALTPGLTAMHTVFQREHNRIVTKLGKVNPHWTDQKLFDEGRKLVSAQLQLITYRDYLPFVIGRDTMEHLNIDISAKKVFKDTYHPNISSAIVNAFHSAGFRFLDSMYHNVVGRRSTKSHHVLEEESLSGHWFNPNLYHMNENLGPDYLNYWTITTRAPRADRFHQPSVRNAFLKFGLANSLDLAAKTIQSGRDQGLPSYNDVREFCGLSRVESFDTLPGGLIDHDPHVAELLSELYTCPDDIDLYAGGLSERRYEDSLVGPVFSCIIGLQFKTLRDGDRFFFESYDPLVGFSKEQLAEIKKVTLASIMCANSPSLKNIQPDVFRVPMGSPESQKTYKNNNNNNNKNKNKRRGNKKKKNYRNSKDKSSSRDRYSSRGRNTNSIMSCDELPQINLMLWQEDSYAIAKLEHRYNLGKGEQPVAAPKVEPVDYNYYYHYYNNLLNA